MTSALSWLNDLFQWLGRWVPRLVLIHATHRGVLFGIKGSVRAVGPGLALYWPITHDLLQVPVTVQNIQLAGQIFPLQTTGSIPKVAVCTLNVQFAISDVVKASVAVLHFQALVSNRAQALALKYWRSGNMGRSLSGDENWIKPAEADLQKELICYGIDLQHLDIAGIGVGVALKNVADWSYADTVNGTRPV